MGCSHVINVASDPLKIAAFEFVTNFPGKAVSDSESFRRFLLQKKSFWYFSSVFGVYPDFFIFCY